MLSGTGARSLVTSTTAGCGADDDEAIDRRPVRRRKEVLIGLDRRRGNLLNPVQGRRACQDSWQSRQVTGLVLRHGTRRIRRGGWCRQVKNGDWNNCWRLGSVYCEGQSFARLLFIVLWGHLTLLVSSKLFHAVKQLRGKGKEPSWLVNGFNRQATHFSCPQHGYANKRGSSLAYQALWGLKVMKTQRRASERYTKVQGAKIHVQRVWLERRRNAWQRSFSARSTHVYLSWASASQCTNHTESGSEWHKTVSAVFHARKRVRSKHSEMC